MYRLPARKLSYARNEQKPTPEEQQEVCIFVCTQGIHIMCYNKPYFYLLMNWYCVIFLQWLSSVVALQSSLAHHMVCYAGDKSSENDTCHMAKTSSVHETAQPTCITTDCAFTNRHSGRNNMDFTSKSSIYTSSSSLCSSAVTSSTNVQSKTKPYSTSTDAIVNGISTTPPLLNYENRNVCVHGNKHRVYHNKSTSPDTHASKDKHLLNNSTPYTERSGSVSPPVKLTNGSTSCTETSSVTCSETDSFVSSVDTNSKQVESDVLSVVQGFRESMVTHYSLETPSTGQSVK